MASCAAQRTTLRPVTANTPRVSFLRDSDANDSLERQDDFVAAATAAVVSSETTLDASPAAKTAAEAAFETVAEAAAACKAPVVLRAGTLAARRKLKCGSLRLDVSLEVDDYEGADDHPDDAVDSNLHGRCGAIAGASEDHFSFETPPHVMLLPEAVATATSPTIAWSSRGRRFRKSSSASSAPLSVADGSATPANDAASRHADFSETAAALLAAAAFPRAASAGAAFTKPPRSPLASLTVISPFSPPLGAQQLSPDVARHADDPRGTTTSHMPLRRRKENRHDHPAAEPAARRQAAARQLAELARGGLLSPAILTADSASSGTSLRRSASTRRGSTAPSTPTGLLTAPSTSSSSSSAGSTTRAPVPSGGSAVTSPIAVIRLSSRVGFVNWRHLPHRPGTAPHPPSPHSVSPQSASPRSISPRSSSMVAKCGSGSGVSRRQTFTIRDTQDVAAAASHGNATEIDRGMSRSWSWSSSKGARDAHCTGARVPATSVAASAATAAVGDISNSKPASVALSVVPPSPSSTPLSIQSRPPLGAFSVRSHSAGSSQLDRPAGFGLPPLSPQGLSLQASSTKSPANAAHSNTGFSFRSLSAESSLLNSQTCYNPQQLPQPANLQVFIPLQSSPQMSPPLSPLFASPLGTPLSSPLRSALKYSPSTDGRRASMEDFEVQRQCGADACCSTENERGSLKRRVTFSDNLHVISL